MARPPISIRDVLIMEFDLAEAALAEGDIAVAERVLDRIDDFYLLHLNPDTAQGEPTIH